MSKLKKSISIILMTTLIFGLSTITVSAFFGDRAVFAEGAESYENVPGIPVLGTRQGTSGILLTRQNTTRLNLNMTGVLVGTMTTRGWWEVDTRGNLLGHGSHSMSVARGPQHCTLSNPRIEVLGNWRPQPTTAFLSFQGTFASFAHAHFVTHSYHMHANGTYSFRVTP